MGPTLMRNLVRGALLAACVHTAGAQGTVTPPARPPGAHPGAEGEARSVRGRVVRGGTETVRPLGGVWVTLHRVGTDRAAPLDSMRADAAGRYAFRYRTSGDPKALYFVSSTHDGIAYFTAPFHERVVAGDDAELVTYDTTSAPVTIRIRARHLVVSAPDSSGTRTIVEIFELSNDSSVTRIARADTGAVWTSDLLDGAKDARLDQTDFSPEAVRFADERVRLFAPFAPGLKQISFSYTVPAKARQLSLLVGAPAEVLEVLVEDPMGSADGAGLLAAGPTTLSGRSFRRFLGHDVGDNTVVRIGVPSRAAASDNQVRVLLIVAALGAALLVGLARSMMRRPATPTGVVDVAALRAQLVALDASFANLANPTADQRADHWQKRAHLDSQITNALAREQGLA